MECVERNSEEDPAYSGSLVSEGHHPEVEELARDGVGRFGELCTYSKVASMALWGGWRTVVRTAASS
jgi:hypothetical protein